MVMMVMVKLMTGVIVFIIAIITVLVIIDCCFGYFDEVLLVFCKLWDETGVVGCLWFDAVHK